MAGAPAPAPQPPPHPVAVIDPDGDLALVPEADARQAFAAGARPAEPEEIRAGMAAQVSAARDAELRAKYGGPLGAAVGSLGADLAGVTRGLGASQGVATDPLVTGIAGAIGGDTAAAAARERLNEFQELHPWQSKRAELLGATLGTALAPEAGVSGAGEAAAQGMGALLGKGAAGFVGRTAVRGARGALEGASYMGTDAVNEAALGDHELTGERLYASMAKGALFGAALTSGVGALGDAGSATLKGGGRLLTKSLGGDGASSVREALEAQADEIAYRAGGGTNAMAKDAERYFPNGTKGVGRVWREEAPGLVGKENWGDMTPEDLLAAAEKGQEKFGRAIDEHLSKLDAAAEQRGLLPRASEVIDQFNLEILAPVQETIGGEAAASKLGAFRDSMAKKWGIPLDEAGVPMAVKPAGHGLESFDRAITFRELREARIAADKVWKGNKLDPDLMGFKGEFLKARGMLEDRLLAAGDELAPELGASFRADYETAKRGYQAFKILERSAESGVAGDARSRILSLTDNIVGSAGAKVGALIGSAAGPIGTAAGAAIGGGAGAIANHVIRKRFNFVAPELLERAASLFRAEKVAVGVERQMNEGVSGFFQGPYRTRASLPASVDAVRPKKGESRAQAHARVAAEITRLANNPQEQAQRFAEETGDLAEHAPKTAAAMAFTQARAAKFLQSKLPPGHIDSKSLTPHLEKPVISDAERTKFARYLSVIDDPTTVLDDMKAGRLAPEQVEALKEVYPRMYDDLRQKVAVELSQQTEPVAYKKKLQLGLLFELKPDATMQDDFISAMQSTYGPAPASDEPYGPPMGGGKPPDIAAGYMTSAQQTEKGNV